MSANVNDNQDENVSKSEIFREIYHHDYTLDLPDRIDVIITKVEPKHCHSLLKELSYFLPMVHSKSNSTQNLPKNYLDNILLSSDNDTGNEYDLSHLRRIRNRFKQRRKSETELSNKKQLKKVEEISSASSPVHKKSRNEANPTLNEAPAIFRLDVLLGTPYTVHSKCPPDELIRLQKKFDLSPFETISVPGRSANSKEELKEWNAIWPTIYFHRKTKEHILMQMALTKEEEYVMITGMKEAISDAKISRDQIKFSQDQYGRGRQKAKDLSIASSTGSFYPFPASSIAGAIIMCPMSNRVISRSSDEYIHQCNSLKIRNGEKNSLQVSKFKWNPLSTSVMLAIQGVSRKERSVAIGRGMNSDEFKKGQYLCTGYDAYLTKEPDIYEAMALTHSRIRRVIFGVTDPLKGGLGGTGDENAVHCLPGTNHHYRVFKCCNNVQFQCDDDNNLWKLCSDLHCDTN